MNLVNRNLCRALMLGVAIFTVPSYGFAGLPHATPADAGMDAVHLGRIRAVVEHGLEDGSMPGCVVCVGRHGKIVYLEAFGDRQLLPEKIPMTVDTLFDMASITKPVATATAIMMLVERGNIRLSDRIADHLPEFGQHGKEAITVRDLLLHQGGLIPDNALGDYDQGREDALRRINSLELRAPPGTRFIYSDVGFIVLAELVRAKTGEDIHTFTRQYLFRPLGMSETGYLPVESLRRRAATTEQRNGEWIQGEVHDPRAYRLGGVAGHAGLFSTARDLALYAQMMLQQGRFAGQRLLGPGTVRVMTTAYEVSSGLRGLGWDKQSGYSSNRSELFSDSAFGHGGFTGTVLWIDPELDLFFIFLSNRLHPDGTGSVNALAGRLGTIAAAAITAPATHTNRSAKRPVSKRGEDDTATQPVWTGIDVLQAEQFQSLEGRRVGLITNQTGINRNGHSTVQILQDAPNVQLKVLFSPEHGFAGQLDQAVITDSQDPKTGLKIYSLYGETRRPTEEMLSDIDALVFDIQDIGARFYTYVSTMGEAMQAAAEHHVPFVVLDRPNPINGVDVAGPVLDSGRESFVGFHRVPLRHGMTVGELAQMIRQEQQIDVDLQVVQLMHWQRHDYFDRTGLLWINPSPNMRNLTEALLYPGIGLLETTNLSVGRGTDTPFELIGAPWLDGQKLADELNSSGLPGVAFVPIRFRPHASKFAGENCSGVNIIIKDWNRFRPVDTGFAIALALRRLFAGQWDVDAYDRLLASQQVLDDVKSGATLGQLRRGYAAELQRFLRRRQAFLLYP